MGIKRQILWNGKAMRPFDRILILVTAEKHGLPGRSPRKLPLTIDDLEDRSAMLDDVRARVSSLKRDLAALL